MNANNANGSRKARRTGTAPWRRHAAPLRTSLLALTCGLTSLGLPLAAHALSLPEAAQLAMRSDPRVQAAAAEVEAARAGVAEARAGYRPSVGVAAEIGRSDFQVDAPFPASGLRTPNSVGAELVQPLYAGGRLDAQLEAAQSGAGGAAERESGTRQQVLLAAINAYLTVQRDRAIIELNDASLRTLQTAAEDTRKRFDAGEATRTDVSQAEARLAEARAAASSARAAQRSSAAAFERVIGVAPEALQDSAREPALPSTLAAALRQAQAAPALREAELQLRQAQAGVDIARAGRLPELKLDAQVGTRDNTEFGYERIDTWSALLKLTVPVYQGGGAQARVSEARAREAQARALSEDVTRAVTESVIQAWETLQAAQERVPAFDAQVQAAQLALDGVRKELEVGSRTTLDLLDAERELLAAQVNLATSRRDRAVAAYRLLAAVGELRPEAVR